MASTTTIPMEEVEAMVFGAKTFEQKGFLIERQLAEWRCFSLATAQRSYGFVLHDDDRAARSICSPSPPQHTDSWSRGQSVDYRTLRTAGCPWPSRVVKRFAATTSPSSSPTAGRRPRPSAIVLKARPPNSERLRQFGNSADALSAERNPPRRAVPWGAVAHFCFPGLSHEMLDRFGACKTHSELRRHRERAELAR